MLPTNESIKHHHTFLLNLLLFQSHIHKHRIIFTYSMLVRLLFVVICKQQLHVASVDNHLLIYVGSDFSIHW